MQPVPQAAERHGADDNTGGVGALGEGVSESFCHFEHGFPGQGEERGAVRYPTGVPAAERFSCHPPAFPGYGPGRYRRNRPGGRGAVCAHLQKSWHGPDPVCHRLPMVRSEGIGRVFPEDGSDRGGKDADSWGKCKEALDFIKSPWYIL